MVTAVEHAVQVSTALFLGILALLVFAARPHAALNRVLGALLLLRGASDLFYEEMRVAATQSESFAAMRTANWFDWPTPFLTLLFLHLLFPSREHTALRRAILAVAALLTLPLVAAFVLEPSLFATLVPGARVPVSAPHWLPNLFRAATFAVQAAGIVVAARTAVSTTARATARRQAGLVGLAFAILLANSAARGAATIAEGAPTTAMLVGDLAGFALFLATIPSLRRLPSAFTGRARPAAIALIVLPAAAGIAETAGPLASTRFLWVAASAACLSLALVRFGLAGLGEGARTRVARSAHVALVAALVVLPAGVVLVALGETSAALAAGILLLLGATTFSAAPRRALVSAFSRLVLVDPSDTLAVGERARTYSAALAEKAKRGDVRPDDPALVSLRAELGLTERDHAELARLVAEHRETTPSLLGRYRVERELGRGASGTAVLAIDEATGTRVVLKRFHAVGADERVLSEARAMTTVKHANVISLLAVERVADEIFLVIAYAEGGNAEDLLQRRGPLPPADALRLARDVLEGLAALHAAGLAHGDVKLPNILLDGEGRALLADLGTARTLARARADVTITSSPVLGSYATLAPELLRGGKRTTEADLYAVGAVLYRLLTGEHYLDFADKDAVALAHAIAHDAPRLPHPRVPPTIEGVISRALAKEPSARYASAQEMLAALPQE